MKKILLNFHPLILFSAFIIMIANTVNAQEAVPPPEGSSAEELAKKLSNPVASLISVPLQNNTDLGIGEFNGSKNILNVQPVIPIKLGSKLNLITRYIIPVVAQNDITGEGINQFGLSDATVSGFFSPTGSTKIIWGIGPALLIPIATDDFLGTKKFGVGPTGLILRQTKGFTFGALLNQIWSVAGDKDRADVSQLFIQPFFSYNWKSGAGLGINAEITQNWEASTTTVFINPLVSGVTKLGKQTISLAVGPRIPVAGPSASKPDFGIRAVLTFVFPK